MFYIKQTLQRNVIRSIWALLLTATCFSAVAQIDKAELDSKKFERIEVKGEKTKVQLQKAFEQQRFVFLEMFNEINDVAKFDMICTRRKTIGSNITRKYCEPRYVKTYRAMMMQDLASGSPGPNKPAFDLMRMKNDKDIYFLTKWTREESYDHVAALIATHPELFEAFKKLDAINRKLKESEEE